MWWCAVGSVGIVRGCVSGDRGSGGVGGGTGWSQAVGSGGISVGCL